MDARANYVSDQISKHLEHNSDVEEFKLDVKLSILKPLHAATLSGCYKYLQGPEGKKLIKSGWKASGITTAVEYSHDHGIDSRMLVNPFSALSIE